MGIKNIIAFQEELERMVITRGEKAKPPEPQPEPVRTAVAAADAAVGYTIHDALQRVERILAETRKVNEENFGGCSNSTVIEELMRHTEERIAQIE